MATAAGRSGGETHWPWRARFAAARSGPLPLRPRHRRDHQPGRSRSRLVDRQAPPRRRRLHRRRPRADAKSPTGASRKRVGIKPEGRAPAREGTVITDASGRQIGIITSGGFGPTVNGPVAMGYVETRIRRTRHTAFSSSCATSPCRPRSSPCPSSPIIINAEEIDL